MRRAILISLLACGCGAPDLDTPASRAGRQTYPALAPSEALRASIPVQSEELKAVPGTLGAEARRVQARGNAARGTGLSAIESADIGGRADRLARAAEETRAEVRAGTEEIARRARGLDGAARGTRSDVQAALGDAEALRERAANIRAAREKSADPDEIRVLLGMAEEVRGQSPEVDAAADALSEEGLTEDELAERARLLRERLERARQGAAE